LEITTTPINKQIACNIFLISNLLAANSYAHELVLTIDQIKQPKGNMMVALYNSKESYQSNAATFSGQKVAVTEKT
jgi:uncharacterized protein (DUF2141 family)